MTPQSWKLTAREAFAVLWSVLCAVVVALSLAVAMSSCGRGVPKGLGAGSMERAGGPSAIRREFQVRRTVPVKRPQIGLAEKTVRPRPHHHRSHKHFIPLYHRFGTEWLGWLADGRPNEEGS